MPIFTIGSRRVLFIHIPKTGGGSIFDWLSTKGKATFFGADHPSSFRCTPQHFTFRDMTFLLDGPAWDFAFAIVRHPLSRLESEFRWRAAGFYRETGKRMTFDVWVDNTLKRAANDPYYLDNHVLPQVNFVDRQMDVFHFESGIENIAAELSDMIGVENDFGNRHKNMTLPLKLDWPVALTYRATEFYKFDFSYFGYDNDTRLPKNPAA
jgi:hypothetical protein